jgi:hypothetical protein
VDGPTFGEYVVGDTVGGLQYERRDAETRLGCRLLQSAFGGGVHSQLQAIILQWQCGRLALKLVRDGSVLLACGDRSGAGLLRAGRCRCGADRAATATVPG